MKAEELARKEVRDPTHLCCVLYGTSHLVMSDLFSQREEREAREVLFIHPPDGSYSVSFDNEISSKRAEKETKEVRSAYTLFCFNAHANCLW